jgi:hypothetical protein
MTEVEVIFVVCVACVFALAMIILYIMNYIYDERHPFGKEDIVMNKFDNEYDIDISIKINGVDIYVPDQETKPIKRTEIITKED